MPRPAWVTLLILDDPHDAGLARAALDSEGIPVMVPGLAHRSLMPGFDGAYIRLPVQVPEDRVADAVDVLTATGFMDEQGQPTNRPGAPPEPEETVGPAPKPRQQEPEDEPRQAPIQLLLVASLLGLAHLAAGRRGVGVLMGACFVLLVVLGSTVAAPTFVLWPLIPIVDLRGALRWRRRAPGAPSEEAGLPLGALAVLALVLAPSLVKTQAPDAFIGGRGRDLCRMSEGCGIETAGQCALGIAGQIGDGAVTWGHVAECHACAQGLPCDDIWFRVSCRDARRYAFHDEVLCDPDGTALVLDRCDRVCSGLLLGVGKRRRAAW